MRLLPDVYLVGSGVLGFGLSDDHDCHIYAIDTDHGITLIDAGGGIAPDRIIANMTADGLDARRVGQILLTHGHADHAGGAGALARMCGAEVWAPVDAVPWIRDGNEAAVSLDVARAAGFYPQDYHLSPCPVAGALRDGDVLPIGSQHQAHVIDTPGHASGHVSFLVVGPNGRCLFPGDTVFFGGQVLIEATYDASPLALKHSVERLAALDFEAFFPGHLSFSLCSGRRHVEAAARAFGGLLLPRGVL